MVGAAMLALLTTLAVAVTAFSVYAGGGAARTSQAWYAEAPEAPAASQASPMAGQAAAVENAKSMSKAFHEAAGRVLPSVVTITTAPAMERATAGEKAAPGDNSEDVPFGFQGTPFGDLFKRPEFHQFFKGLPPMPHGHGMAGAGSGVIVDPSGIILTNNHVVTGGGRVTVRLHDGREFPATDIKTDPKTDLAILRIHAGGKLPAAALGDSEKVDVGDWVLALGQPFGLEGTVTAGIVSAKGRGLGITQREDFIQTDAAINPGNSGGPLVNLDGQVVAINTAISSSSGGYQGVGFAIPIDLAKWVGGQLEQGGKVHRAYLGVGIQPVTQSLAEQFKVQVHSGVLVTDVRPDTPAAKAGLKSGDIILKFGGRPVSTPRQLQAIVETAPIGSTQPLAVLRDGKPLTLSVTCREMPGDFSLAADGAPPPGNAETARLDRLGLQVENLTPQLAEQLGVHAEHGVAVTEVRAGSLAEMAGLRTGMVITQANRLPVNSVEDLRKAVEAKPLDQGLLLLVRSAEGSRFVVLRADSK
jgi:serine protease Do